MAEVMKRRRLVNSGRKRRMTAKQIKFFGTARQRAALRTGHRRRKRNYGTVHGRSWSRASGSHKKAPAKRRKRAGARKNPSRFVNKAKRFFTGRSRRRRLASHKAVRRITRRRKNVGQIFSIGMLGGNPGRKRRRNKGMAKHRRRRNAHRAKTYRRRRKHVMNPRRHYRRHRTRNAGYSRRRRHVVRHHRRHRNPGISSVTGWFKDALAIIGGAVGSRYITQFALSGNNTGWMGYLGNAVASVALGWGIGKWLGKPMGTMVMIGGFTGLTLRLLSDLTPIGQYVNLQLSGAGKGGDAGIGLITDSTFFVPLVPNSGSMTSFQMPAAVQTMIAAGSGGKGVGAYGRRRMAASFR